MNNLHPSFTEILQNAIKAIEPKQTPMPPMITVDFFDFEFHPAKNAIYFMISRLEKEKREAEEQAQKYENDCSSRRHYEMIANFRNEDIKALKMAANAFYHAREKAAHANA